MNGWTRSRCQRNLPAATCGGRAASCPPPDRLPGRASSVCWGDQMILFARRSRAARRANQTTVSSRATVMLAAIASTILLATGTAMPAAASSSVTFDGSPGTNPPPPTLGGYQMTAFGTDSQPTGQLVSGVDDTAGPITFSNDLNHTTVGSGWSTWSNNYTGDV